MDPASDEVAEDWRRVVEDDILLCNAPNFLFCFCYSFILSPVGQRADWLLSDEYLLIVSHDSWYNSMFADCLVIVVSRHNMLPNNQDLSIMIVDIPNVIVRSEV